jgi:hypothetical protein
MFAGHHRFPFPHAFRVLIIVTLFLSAEWSPMMAQTSAAEPLAARPPMGWNSWDSYGLTITEAQFRDNVRVLDDSLKQFGWNYALIDEGWFLRNPEEISHPDHLLYTIDSNGRYIPVADRFPSSVRDGKEVGFQQIAEEVHSRGLKFGIHIVRGIPRESTSRNSPIANSSYHATDAADKTDPCPWDPTNWGVRSTPAGQAWYDSLIAQYAGWGVDYLKVDCVSDHPYRPGEIQMIHNAILKSGRPIVLSLSPGPTSPSLANELLPYAQMWRISDDIWDDWVKPTGVMRGVRDQFALAASWAPYARPGSWPDADMLPFGYLGPKPGEGIARETMLTHDEQRSMMTLWAIARSPLILGANLTKLDAWTRSLITNPEVLLINQTGHDQGQVAREGNTVVWMSKGEGEIRYLAFFNLSDRNKTIKRTFGFYNLPASTYQSRDVWSGGDGKDSTGVDLTLPPHSCILLRLTPSPVPR